MNQVLRRGDERRRLALGHFRGGLTKLIWEQTYRKFANHWERKLSDDLDVETSAPPGFGNAWIQGALTAIASCKVIARTNEGNIRLSFPADPRTGLDVIGRAAKGRVIIGINDARSEERRVGKECRSRGVRYHGQEKGNSKVSEW